MSTTEQGAGSAEIATPWSHRRRCIISLAACVGMPAALCVQSGVVARGPLVFDGGRFGVGDAPFHADLLGAVTVEPDLVTVHVGALL